MRWSRNRVVAAPMMVAGIAVTVAWAVLSFRGSPRAFLDLDVYRLGFSAWWHGRNVYGVLPKTVIGSPFPFTYPPFAILVFGPLAALSWSGAIIAMMVVSLAALCCVVYVTFRSVRPQASVRRLIVLTAVSLPLWLVLEPVRDTIWFGQVNLVLVALVALDCLAPRTRWPRGVLVGVAAAIKLTPAVFLLYFLLRRDYRAAATAAISGVVATALGFLADWSGSARYWFSSSGGAHAVGDPSIVTNQSLNGALLRLGLHGSAETLLWLGLCGVAVLLAVLASRRAGQPAVAMVIIGTLGLLVSPISWSHHWVYVVPAVIVLVAGGVRHRRVGWLLAVAVTLAFMVWAPFLALWAPASLSPLHRLESDGYPLLGLTLLLLAAFVRGGPLRADTEIILVAQPVVPLPDQHTRNSLPAGSGITAK